MDKPSNQLGVQPIARISPVMSIAGLSQSTQAFGARDQALAQHQSTLLNSGFAEVGPTKLGAAVSTAELSPLARYLNQSLQQATTNAYAHLTVAQSLITTDPKQTLQFSQALSRTISQSGLFYESHLADAVDGLRAFASVKLEPQAQSQSIAYAMLPQQLHLLEHQRIAWHGEVWPNQLMEWQIHLPEQAADHQANGTQQESLPTVTTDLTLDLPQLGKVHAQIRLVKGKVQLQLSADNHHAMKQFRQYGSVLVKAIEQRGQVIEAMHVQSADSAGQDA